MSSHPRRHRLRRRCSLQPSWWHGRGGGGDVHPMRRRLAVDELLAASSSMLQAASLVMARWDRAGVAHLFSPLAASRHGPTISHCSLLPARAAQTPPCTFFNFDGATLTASHHAPRGHHQSLCIKLAKHFFGVPQDPHSSSLHLAEVTGYRAVARGGLALSDCYFSPLGSVGKAKAGSNLMTWTAWVQVPTCPDADYLLC